MEQSDGSHDLFPTKKTRRRVVLVCGLCHKNKLKCDRQKPCSSCKTRGNALGCSYSPDIEVQECSLTKFQASQQDRVASRPLPSNEQSSQTVPQKRSFAKDDELKQRLDKLESLIVEAVSDRSQKNEHGYPTPEAITEDVHPLHLEKGTPYHTGALQRYGRDSTYTGETAFATILEEVSHCICNHGV